MFDNYKILIISKKEKSERKRFQNNQAKKYNLKIQYLDAVTPDTMPKEIFNKYKNSWARPLRDNEVACTYSHMLAWKKVLDWNVPTLILEDDAVLCSSIKIILEGVSIIKGEDYLQFETFNAEKLLSKSCTKLKISNYCLHILHRDRGGSAAYFVFPNGAKKLISSLKKSYPPSDAAIHLAPGIKRLQIVPAAAVQIMNLTTKQKKSLNIKTLMKSMISNEPKPPYSSKLRWCIHKSKRLMISFKLFYRIIFAKKSHYLLLKFSEK